MVTLNVRCRRPLTGRSRRSFQSLLPSSILSVNRRPPHHHAVIGVCGKNTLRMLFLRCFLLRICTPSLIPGERQLSSKHPVSSFPCTKANDLPNFPDSSRLHETHAYVSPCVERTETNVSSHAHSPTPTWQPAGCDCTSGNHWAINTQS